MNERSEDVLWCICKESAKTIAFCLALLAAIAVSVVVVVVFKATDATQPQQVTAAAPLNEAELEELGPSVLAQLPGFDANTQQVMDMNNEIVDLRFRVSKLETEVRRLNQLVLGIPEIRIGDAPPETSKGE